VSQPYILLVEDNPDDEELTLLALRRAKIVNEIVVARDGAEALEILFAKAQEGSLPALTMLDLNLPKVSGLEVLRHMRADPRTSLLPVIILTSSKEHDDVVAGYNLRTNAYVRKPVAFDEFAEAVRILGLFWLVFNQPPPGGARGATAVGALTQGAAARTDG